MKESYKSRVYTERPAYADFDAPNKFQAIQIGTAVIIDGQRYLAADTGVTGYHVDICAADHQENVLWSTF